MSSRCRIRKNLQFASSCCRGGFPLLKPIWLSKHSWSSFLDSLLFLLFPVTFLHVVGLLEAHKNEITLQEWIHHKKRKWSDLNFLREVKKKSKKCKSETYNPVSTEGHFYHFISNHFNGLKQWFSSVPSESLKSRDPSGQEVQEVRTIFTTTLNITSILILFWGHSGVLQRHNMWYYNIKD